MDFKRIKYLIDRISDLKEKDERILKESISVKEKNKANIEINIYNSFLELLSQDINYNDLYELKKSNYQMYLNYLQLYNSSEEEDKLENYETNYNTYFALFDLLSSFLEGVTLINNSYSNTIVSKLMKYNVTQDKSLLKEIFDLKDQRRLFSINKYSDSILEDLTYLESLEYLIAMSNYNKIDSYTLNKKEYRRSLMDTIKAINDYYFLAYKKSKFYVANNTISEDDNNKIFYNRLLSNIKKYNNLIKSVSNNKIVVINVNDRKVSSENLLSYLSIYNIDSNYDIFKLSTKNKLINSHVVSKNEYDKEVKFINKYIDSLCDYLLDKIKAEEVQINDNSKDRDELVYQRDELISNLSKYGRNDTYASK